MTFTNVYGSLHDCYTVRVVLLNFHRCRSTPKLKAASLARTAVDLFCTVHEIIAEEVKLFGLANSCCSEILFSPLCRV